MANRETDLILVQTILNGFTQVLNELMYHMMKIQTMIANRTPQRPFDQSNEESSIEFMDADDDNNDNEDDGDDLSSNCSSMTNYNEDEDNAVDFNFFNKAINDKHNDKNIDVTKGGQVQEKCVKNDK